MYVRWPSRDISGRPVRMHVFIGVMKVSLALSHHHTFTCYHETGVLICGLLSAHARSLAPVARSGSTETSVYIYSVMLRHCNADIAYRRINYSMVIVTEETGGILKEAFVFNL